ncbi:unnamed protein product [Diplocarpon coronariae]
MPLILRRAVLTDAAILTDIYFSAFNVDAVSLLVFPRNSSSWNWWYDSVINEIADLNAHFVCIYDSDSEDQRVTDIPTWPEEADGALANHFFGSLINQHAKIMKGKRHWYLELIATTPQYQGKGAAGQLLRWGIARSDEEGTETYLEASPDGKPIYEHLGFEEVGRMVVELDGKGEGVLAEKDFVEVFMVRGIQKR